MRLLALVVSMYVVARALRRRPKVVETSNPFNAGALAEIVVARIETSNRESARVRRRVVVLTRRRAGRSSS